MANSSMLALPRITAPSRRRRATTVASKGGTKVLQDFGGAGGPEPLGDHDVLQGQGDAGEGRGLAPAQARLGCPGLLQGPGFIHGQIGVQLAVALFDALQQLGRHLHRGDLAAGPGAGANLLMLRLYKGSVI